MPVTAMALRSSCLRTCQRFSGVARDGSLISPMSPLVAQTQGYAGAPPAASLARSPPEAKPSSSGWAKQARTERREMFGVDIFPNIRTRAVRGLIGFCSPSLRMVHYGSAIKIRN